jgi:hypothetical protein
MSQVITEVVVYSLKSGVSRPAFLEAAAASQRWLQSQPGFLSRELLEDAAQGAWVDLVRWSSLSEAHGASAKLVKEPGLAPFLQAIAEASIRMVHAAAVPL